MFIGIDLGTSSVKIVVIDENQEIVFEVGKPLTVSHPKPLFSEQNPGDWWEKTREALSEIPEKMKREVLSIGLSGQMHGATLLGKGDAVLRPAILWNDGRSFEECAFLEKEVKDFAEITANRIMPGFTAPKLVWVKNHESDIFAQVEKVLLPKDYLRLQLTGEYASDMSDAAGTLWLDVKNRKWSETMLSACSLSLEKMPKVFEGSEVTGQLKKEIAKEFGFSETVTVVGGGGDNAASAISSGVIENGKAFLSLGTSGVYFVSMDSYKANPKGGVHTFCHCLPNLWHQMTVHLSSASSLDWLKKILEKPVRELVKDAEKAKSFDPVLFLPYLSGERTPYNDPYARGVFFGLGETTTREDLAKAVMEGVAFAFAIGQDKMREAGIHIDEVSVLGGGAKSLYWGQILASALNRPLTYRANAKVGGAFGAARLAFLGHVKGDPAKILTMPKKEKEILPEEKFVVHYQKKREIFDALYPALKEIYRKSYEFGETA